MDSPRENGARPCRPKKPCGKRRRIGYQSAVLSAGDQLA